MVGFWIFKFHQNEDVSSIEYISYESHSDITYPEFSLCIDMPFMYENLAWGLGSNVSVNEYHRYLEGQSDFREIYRHINYTNVTLNLFEYVQKAIVNMRNETYNIQSLKNRSHLLFLMTSIIRNMSSVGFTIWNIIQIKQGFLRNNANVMNNVA